MIENWISHLNGFRERRKREPLNTNEIALYYILMEYDNELGWMDWFGVANGVLQGLSGLSRTAFHTARNELARKQYIQYKIGGGNRSGRYLIVDLGKQTRTQTRTQTGTQTGPEPAPLTKPKQKPKQEGFAQQGPPARTAGGNPFERLRAGPTEEGETGHDA